MNIFFYFYLQRQKQKISDKCEIIKYEYEET